MRKITWWIKILWYLALLSLLYACGKKEESKTELVRPAKVMVVGEAVTSEVRHFPGKVLASKKAILSFEVPGTLIVFPVQEGTKANAGELLARIDPDRYRDRVTEMKAKLVRAKAEYERAVKLVKDNFISKAEYDAKKAAYHVAIANYNTAVEDLNDTILRAPFKGVVARTYVKNHEAVKSKQKIILFHDVSLIDLEIFVPENIIFNINRGEAKDARVEFDSLPNKTFPVKLKEFSSSADPQTQTYRVVYQMKAPEDFNVLPGMTITIQAAIPDFKSGSGSFYEVPASAIFSEAKQQSYVWLVNQKDNTVKKHPVSVSRLAKNEVRVTSGLKKGDMIVVAGVNFLREGERIKPIKQEKNLP